MNFDLFFARTWIVFVAFMAAFVTFGCMAICMNYYREWRRSKAKDISSNVIGTTASAILLLALLYAIMDVGQAFALVTDKWEAVVGICSGAILPVYYYKTRTKLADINSQKPE